ncbi:MAG: mannosyltransferase family protein [Myxococcota bacterium]
MTAASSAPATATSARAATVYPWWVWLGGTRLLAEMAMAAGTYFPRPKAKYEWWIGEDHGFFWQQVPHRLLDVWGRWDSFFYVSIAERGYPGPSPDGGWVYHAAFFPFFPALMRGLSELLGGVHVFYAGLFLAHGMLVLALVYLDRLVRLDRSPAFATLVVTCLLCFPGSHFLSCVYPESTSLFLSVFAVYCARTHRPALAGLACMLAVWTRSNGFLICLPVLYELCRTEEGRLSFSWRVLVLLLPAAAVAVLLGLHQGLYGDPLYFVHVQAGWGRKPSFPLEPFFRLGVTLDHHLFALLAVALLVWGIWQRRWRTGYLALGAANLLLPLSTGMLRGIHRYSAWNYPLFFFLADWLEHRPQARRVLAAVGLATMAFFAFRWGQGNHPN